MRSTGRKTRVRPRVFRPSRSSISIRKTPSSFSSLDKLDCVLLREADTVQHVAKALLEALVIPLRSDANEVDQTFRPHHGDDPIDLPPTERRIVFQKRREARLAAQFHGPGLANH